MIISIDGIQWLNIHSLNRFLNIQRHQLAIPSISLVVLFMMRHFLQVLVQNTKVILCVSHKVRFIHWNCWKEIVTTPVVAEYRNNLWSRLAPLMVSRHSASAISIGGQTLVIGGSNSFNETSSAITWVDLNVPK